MSITYCLDPDLGQTVVPHDNDRAYYGTTDRGRRGRASPGEIVKCFNRTTSNNLDSISDLGQNGSKYGEKALYNK